MEAQQTEAAEKGKQIQQETLLDELQLDYDPLPTALTRPDYEPDSQTIIIDTNWVRAVEPIVISIN